MYVTLSGGAPAGDGAAHGVLQGAHPDLDGSDVPVVVQGGLELHQSHVKLLGTPAVARVVHDPGHAHQLGRHL